jgi:hypothetical protein
VAVLPLPPSGGRPPSPATLLPLSLTVVALRLPPGVSSSASRRAQIRLLELPRAMSLAVAEARVVTPLPTSLIGRLHRPTASLTREPRLSRWPAAPRQRAGGLHPGPRGKEEDEFVGDLHLRQLAGGVGAPSWTGEMSGEEKKKMVILLMPRYERPNTNWYSLVLSIPSNKFICIQTMDLVLDPNTNTILFWH